ncbi:MAG TPA: parallel beta-helix domain-containing protein [Polyangiaceae bacterium]
MKGAASLASCACAVVLGVACHSSSSSHAIGSSSPLCTGSGRCLAISPGVSEADIAGAFATTQDGDTIAFAAGTYEFTNQLALGTGNGVSVVGAGPDQTTLDFHGQAAGEDGIFAQSISDLRFEGFTILDTPGNGIKALGITGVTFRTVAATWTALDATDGAYGLYPVQSSDVLVEGCTISGASDSGIYIGQSKTIVARRNEAFSNVTGIEIENSFDADVYENKAHDNTGGILVFDLPGLQQEGGHSIRVYNNTVTANNTENFAPSSDIVNLVPAGTGFFVMANHDVEVFGNTFTGNHTASVGIISYAVAQTPFTDPNYYEWPSRVFVHDNTFSGGGTLPDARSQVGLLLSTGMAVYPGGHVPDVMYDGILDPKATPGPDPMTICVHEPTASAVCNMHFDKIDPNNPDLRKTIVCDPAPYACTLPALPAVSLPGLSP